MLRKLNIQSILMGLMLLAAAALSFTNFYSVGYVLAIIVSTVAINQLYVFKTLLQKFVLLFFTFIATIPLVGLICWSIGTELLPIFNLIGFVLIVSILHSRRSKIQRNTPLVDKADIVAILVAIAPVFVIFATYMTAPNLSASLFQLASEGWDNGSHVIMIENSSSLRGYAYGEAGADSNKFYAEGTSYPQGWHLATADFVNGFGGNRFKAEQPIPTILAYTVASIGWMMSACYLFVLCAWRFYEQSANKILKKLTEIAPLVAISLVVVIVVFVSAFMHGFTNYIGTLAYIILLCAMIIEAQRSANRHIYILATLFATMTVLTWFLTLPAAALAILLMILKRFDTIKESLLRAGKDWIFIAFAVLCSVAMASQLYIFQSSTSTSTTATNQLNEGVRVFPFDMLDGGPMQISPILFGLVTAAFIAYLLLDKVKIQIKQALLVLILPWLILVFVVYFYQNVTVGYNTYYLPKVVGLSLVVSLLSISGLIISKIADIKIPHPKLMVPVVSLLAVSTLIIGTGQPTYGLTKLFQSNARTNYSVAATITPLLPQTADGSTYIVTLIDRVNYEDIQEDDHGKLEIRVGNTQRNCTYAITKYRPLEQKIRRLSSCADKLAKDNKKIVVVTTNDVASKIEALAKSNIEVKVAP